MNQLLNIIIPVVVNQVVPAFVAIIVAMLLKAIAPVGDAIVSFIKKKEEDVAVKIGVDKYNGDLAVARNVWNIVDEYFRITPTVIKTIDSAQKKFSEELLKRIPGLSQDDIEHLRQAIAGEVNKGKAAISQPIQPVLNINGSVDTNKIAETLVNNLNENASNQASQAQQDTIKDMHADTVEENVEPQVKAAQ